VKAVTIHLPEETYRAFEKRAAQSGISVEELMRTAMESYHSHNLSSSRSIFDTSPADLGKPLRPLGPDDDLLEEMLG
jgi:hypothetical protein